jgi:hypothetical protein
MRFSLKLCALVFTVAPPSPLRRFDEASRVPYVALVEIGRDEPTVVMLTYRTVK